LFSIKEETFSEEHESKLYIRQGFQCNRNYTREICVDSMDERECQKIGGINIILQANESLFAKKKNK
uniref:Ovule protein n=1 Tax=Strongyloides papillosus TaxID=174720 RepID=A0A0N5BWU4_STREA